MHRGLYSKDNVILEVISIEGIVRFGKTVRRDDIKGSRTKSQGQVGGLLRLIGQKSLNELINLEVTVKHEISTVLSKQQDNFGLNYAFKFQNCTP
jgi:hypothetical protein